MSSLVDSEKQDEEKKNTLEACAQMPPSCFLKRLLKMKDNSGLCFHFSLITWSNWEVHSSTVNLLARWQKLQVENMYNYSFILSYLLVHVRILLNILGEKVAVCDCQQGGKLNGQVNTHSIKSADSLANPVWVSRQVSAIQRCKCWLLRPNSRKEVVSVQIKLDHF